MLILDSYIPTIKTELSNGIYVFDSQSSTGKTRLRKELRKYQQYGEKVASYSYEDYLIELPLEKILEKNKYKLIMLDRYDMYKGAGSELIICCKDSTIILIDCKGDLGFNVEYGWCTIEMTDKLIEVVQ